MNTTKIISLLVAACFFSGLTNTSNAQPKKVPGTVVSHIPAKTKVYIGSPAICVLSDGDYVASHDYFGQGTTFNKEGTTAVYRSDNKGKTWQKISEINGQFWSSLFVHKDKLYLMGTWNKDGNFIIRRSDDGGVTWTSPEDGTTGLLLEGRYSTAPTPVIVHDGRIWRAFENAKADTRAWGKRFSAMAISAPEDADLLNAKNWTTTNHLPYDSTYLNGSFGGWLEGNAVVTPEGGIVDILRVEIKSPGAEVAAIVQISSDGQQASFDPATGFVEFPGGAKKFTIRFDEKSKRYWTLSNIVKQEYAHLSPGGVRNTLALMSSSDLKSWTVHKILLEHPDKEKHGFQYVDWQFDGRHIIFVSRTAYDDVLGGAHNAHDANYFTFHRIRNFRNHIP